MWQFPKRPRAGLLAAMMASVLVTGVQLPAQAQGQPAASQPIILAQTDFKEIMRGIQERENPRRRLPPPEMRDRDERDWQRERDRRRWEERRDRDRWEDRRARDRWERRNPPRRDYRQGGLTRHQADCARRYRTYDPGTNTYFIRPGVRAVCR